MHKPLGFSVLQERVNVVVHAALRMHVLNSTLTHGLHCHVGQ